MQKDRLISSDLGQSRNTRNRLEPIAQYFGFGNVLAMVERLGCGCGDISTNARRMKVNLLIILLIGFCSCSSNKKTENHSSNISDNSEETKVINRTESTNKKEVIDDDCVFDTSSYKFTSEAIYKFDSNLKFHWNDKEKEAVVKMNNGDTLILHIGGCYHFSYSAEYHTDSSKFNDEKYLFEKARWLAKNFFDNGFEEFDRYIANKNYELVDNQINFRGYSINIDTSITQVNEIFDGFSFEKTNGRTVIGLLGYVN